MNFRPNSLVGTVVFVGVLWMIVSSSTPLACGEQFNYDETKVPVYTLPELLRNQEGTVVDSAEKWESVRRPEILKLLQDHVFGTHPPKISQLRSRLRAEVHDAIGGKALRREITVFFTNEDNGPRMDMLVYSPVNATTAVPAFLGLNFNGNHAIESDPRLHITTSWVRTVWPEVVACERHACDRQPGND